MSLLPLFQWCEASTIGSAIRTSPWAFAVVESIHLLGLAAIGGAVLVVDLRLLGLGLRRQSVREVARDAQPWLLGSLAVMVTTGAALFLSVAIAFTFTVRRKVTANDTARSRPVEQKLVAIVSLALWLGVAASGRWIGFSG